MSGVEVEGTGWVMSEKPPPDARPKFVVLQGRGDRGKSTLCRVLIERATLAGRNVQAVDVDRSTRALSQYVDGVLRPDATDAYSVTVWLHAMVNQAIEAKMPILVDVGGGDDTFATFSREVDLPALLEEHGIQPVSLFLLGTDPVELGLLAEAREAGFWPQTRALVLCSKVRQPGQAEQAAFAAIRGHAKYKEALKESREVFFPKLSATCMATIEEKGLSFKKAETDPTLGPTYQQLVRMWWRNTEQMLAPVRDYLP